MTASTILLEVENLHAVSSRLDALADQHPVVSEGLLAIGWAVALVVTCASVFRHDRAVRFAGLSDKVRGAVEGNHRG